MEDDFNIRDYIYGIDKDSIADRESEAGKRFYKHMQDARDSRSKASGLNLPFIVGAVNEAIAAFESKIDLPSDYYAMVKKNLIRSRDMIVATLAFIEREDAEAYIRMLQYEVRMKKGLD